MRNWTELEVSLLKENWPDKGTKFCTSILNRTIAAIATKSKKLGLVRNRCGYRSNTKDYNCWRRYGLTPEQYDDIFENQKGVCAICGQVEMESNQYGVKRLCVDHCHKTGIVRGLLCRKCNSLIGFAGDNIKILKKSIQYLNDTFGATDSSRTANLNQQQSRTALTE